MVYKRTSGTDIDSWYRHGLMVETLTHGMDIDSWYRNRLKVQTRTHGIDMDSHKILPSTHGIVSVLLNHTCMRGPSLAQMQDLFDVEHFTVRMD